MRAIRVFEARRVAIELPRKTLAARLAMSLRTLERVLAGERELTSMELHKFAELVGLDSLSMPTITLELAKREKALALEVVDHRQPPAQAPDGGEGVHRSIDDRITTALAEVGRPQAFADLRAICRVRTATLYERLAAMAAAGRIVKSADGYHLAAR